MLIMPAFLSTFLLKLIAIPLRIIDLLRYLPVRGLRILRHFPQGFNHLYRAMQDGSLSKFFGGHILRWWLDLIWMLLDLLGIGEWYEIVNDFLKPNSRPMTPQEEKMARIIFGNSINYRRVRIDEYAILGPRQYRFCYVSFYIINFWGKVGNSLLIHELVHVWQYQRYGVLYIPRALAAQQTAEGYNYGGVEGLDRARRKGWSLGDFNYEQQADIVADYYRLSNGLSPRWGRGSAQDLPVYAYFVHQLKRRV